MRPKRPSSEWIESTQALFARLSGQWDDAATEDVISRRKILSELTRQITDAFRHVGIPETQLASLQVLNRALFDLHNEVRHPLFAIHAPGRERGGSHSVQRRVYAAALAKWLAPLPVKEAQALIAKEFTRVGHRGYNGKGITVHTVRKWCEAVYVSGDRKDEKRLAEWKLAQWRERDAALSTPCPRAEFVRYIAAGLLEEISLTP